jgi:hypothetical protein
MHECVEAHGGRPALDVLRPVVDQHARIAQLPAYGIETGPQRPLVRDVCCSRADPDAEGAQLLGQRLQALGRACQERHVGPLASEAQRDRAAESWPRGDDGDGLGHR